MKTLFVEAALLGLSTGIYCLGYCLPVLFPLFMGEERPSLIKRSCILLKFSGGRLIAYLLFGAVVGYSGEKVFNPLVQKIIAISMILLSILLIIYGVSNRSPVKVCQFSWLFNRIKLPFVFGFLTGFNICPPFLLAISYVSGLADLIKGVYFFLVFFLITNLYLVLLVLAGHFSKYRQMRGIARTSAVISGLLFLFIGLNKYFFAYQLIANK